MEYLKSPRMRLFLGVFVLFFATLICSQVFGKAPYGRLLFLANIAAAVALLGCAIYLAVGRRR